MFKYRTTYPEEDIATIANLTDLINEETIIANTER